MHPFRVITGTGLATAQGADVESNWQRLFDGAILHETGRVPLPSDGTARASQLAIHVASQALAAGDWTPSMLQDPRTALVVGTSKGAIDEWLHAADGAAPYPAVFGLGSIAADLGIALRLGFGPRLTLAGACASGLQALIRADQLLRAGVCDRALVVAVESSLHPMFQANFKRLGVLADPKIGCKPFDVHRQGFLMAEAAAALCLELRIKPGCINVGGSAMFADATHLTGLARDGTTVANALSRAEILSADLLHAHGTGTIQNDAVELAALENLRGGNPPPIYSHKHAIGHTQGAAGLIAAVLNVQMHRRGCVLPNANSPSPAITKGEALPRMPKPMTVNRSTIHAAGFGGAIAAIQLYSA